MADWILSLVSKSCLSRADNRRMTVSAVAVDQDDWCSPRQTRCCGGRMPWARHRWASTLRQHVSSPSLSAQWSRVALSAVRYSLLSGRPMSTRLSASSGKLTTSYVQTRHMQKKVKGKYVDLYSACHVQDTSNAHLRHWNWAARPLFRSPHSLQTQP